MTATDSAVRDGRRAGKGSDRTPRRRRVAQHRWLPYLLLAPAIIFELLVHVIPMLTGIGISFLKLNQFFLRNWLEAPFAGLSNYHYAIDVNGSIGKALIWSFVVTIGFTILVVGISWVLGMFAAVMLQRSFRGRALLRTIFLIPYALPVYAGVIVWKFMLSRDNGMVNHLLAQLHITDGHTFWLIGNNAFASIVVVAVWRLWPFALLTLMAGMQSLPTDVYEAAAVDGAGMWQQFRKLTLPMLRGINQVLILVLFLWTFNDFNVPYTLFSASIPKSADLISIHVYQSSFQNFNFGLGSAMSVLLLLFLLVVTGVYLLFTSRRSRRA
ncbi:ABC transporter permease [Actinocatenispora thailandica]|uniref:ABC transporter permease n=1 Tax=Actinocatenispora thailandica TaxID=227318 RepID=A0A7R7HZ67_9ACTN|nr:sugar ABC transporter permease [Actinocatenispora thailandica]BCJ36803.1 ABC transporter permease [Actinocatenispora thailandica]